MRERIRKWIFCRVHTHLTFCTKELTQMLADGESCLLRYPVVKRCWGCGRYYVGIKWIEYVKSVRKALGIR